MAELSRASRENGLSYSDHVIYSEKADIWNSKIDSVLESAIKAFKIKLNPQSPGR